MANSLREHLEYLSALKRIHDAAHKRRWAGNRLGELEDAIVNGGDQIWTPLCALVAEFKDNPRAHALIYARLHAKGSDWQRDLVARMIMEMVPNTPGALDELVAGFAKAASPLTARMVIAVALERDTGQGPKPSGYRAHDEKRYPIPQPRADWSYRGVGGVCRMGDLQRRLLSHPGFGSAVVEFLRTRRGQPDQPYLSGPDKEAYQARSAWLAQRGAEIEIIRIMRRAIDRELPACGSEEADWTAVLVRLRSDITAEFDRMFATVFGVVADDVESLTDFVRRRSAEHEGYFSHGMEKLRDSSHKSEVRERLETFLLSSRVITSPSWGQGSIQAEGPRWNAWSALRMMLWEPGDPDRFAERLMAQSDTPRFSLENRNTEAMFELPTPKDPYGSRPLTEVFVSREVFAAFMAAAFPQVPPNLTWRFPAETDPA